jgi:hypothetical protein
VGDVSQIGGERKLSPTGRARGSVTTSNDFEAACESRQVARPVMTRVVVGQENSGGEGGGLVRTILRIINVTGRWESKISAP